MPVSNATFDPALPQPSGAGTTATPAVPEQATRTRKAGAGQGRDNPAEDRDQSAEQPAEARRDDEERFLAGYYLG